MKKLLIVFAGTLVFALGTSASIVLANPPGGPHTPVTICHKPGTPAEHAIVVDDDAVPAHLDHGDYLGSCQGTTTTDTTDTTETTTETTTTDTTTESTTTETTTDQTTTDVTTTEETNTTPMPPCPNGEEPIHGKDGAPGNDACDPCAPPRNFEKCPEPSDSTTTETTSESTPTETTTTTETVTEPDATVTFPPIVREKELEKELKKQEKKNGVSKSATATASPQAPNELPYTGMPLWAVALLGGSMVGSGLYLRRR